LTCPITVSVAQINFHPAFVGDGIDYLIEPSGDDSTTISKLDYSYFGELSTKLKSRYLLWLYKKIETIVKEAIKIGTDILVFPEYSIPAILLPEIYKLTKESRLTVIAGSHMITSHNLGIYSDLCLPLNNSHIGFAVSPVIVPSGKHDIIFKYNKSKWENGLEVPKSEDFKIIKYTINDQTINLGILLCIDGIRVPFHHLEAENTLIIVPSWSPSTTVFDATGIIARYNEMALVYANTSQIGGSKIHAPFPESDRHWFADKDSTKILPKNSEGLLTVKLDLNNMKRSKATARENIAAEIVDVSNIEYGQTLTGEENIKLLSLLSESYNETMVQQLLHNSNDLLLKTKLNILQQQNRLGVLRDTSMKNLSKFIKIDEITYGDFKREQAKTALDYIAANLTYDQEALSNLGALSNMVSSGKNNKPRDLNNSIEEKPFYDREIELTKIRKFFDDSNEKLLILQGIRGIGKTSLAEQITRRILPRNSPWRKITINFNSGYGFPLFIHELSYNLGLSSRLDANNPEMTGNIINEVLTALFSYQASYVIMDDFHNVLDKEGSYVDHRFKEFFDEFLRRSTVNCKIIIISNRHLNLESRIIPNTVTLRGLKDENIFAIIDYHYKNMSGRVSGIKLSSDIIKSLHGNPLAALVTSQYLQNHSGKSLEENSDFLKRFQEQIITNLLEEIVFSPEEQDLIDFISTSKNDIHNSVLYEWRPGCINEVDSLCSRFILEFNPETETYRIHPLIRDHFYNELSFSLRIELHQKLAEINNGLIENIKKQNKSVSPKILSELVYHYAGSLQITKINELEYYYQDELRPIADNFFKSKKYQDALDYYLTLLDISKTNRLDVLEKIFMSYGNLNAWSDAQKYFDMAIKEKNKVYLYANYSYLLARKTRSFDEAESIALLGEELYFQINSNKSWELAKIKLALGKIREKQSNRESLQFYKEACELDKTNVFYKFIYANNLSHLGYDASTIIEEGLNIDKLYGPLLSLREELHTAKP
jgi:predicted amidohydrolase/DNA polymerase III delta prime subunit